MEEGAEPCVLSVSKSDDEPVEAHNHHTNITNRTLTDDSNEYVYHNGFYTVSDQTAEHNGAESVSDITEISTNGFSKSSVSTNNITSTEGIQSPMEELHIIEISDLNSSPKDYKTFYEESQSKLSERTEHFLKQVLNLTSDYNDEQTNYELKTKHKELLATNANIVCDHEVVTPTYKAIIIEKDAIISAKEGELINLQNEAPCRFQVPLIKNSGTDQSFRSKPKKVK